MSCLCQYVVDTSNSVNGEIEPIGFPLPDPNCTAHRQVMPALYQGIPPNVSANAVTDDTKITACVSEMAAFRTENWLLKKQLEESKEALKNLERMMIGILNKQTKTMSYVEQLRQRNEELKTECDLQRQYHTIERDALIKELYNVKKLNAEENESDMSSEAQMGSDSDGRDTEEAGFGDEENSSEISGMSYPGQGSDIWESDPVAYEGEFQSQHESSYNEADWE